MYQEPEMMNVSFYSLLERSKDFGDAFIFIENTQKWFVLWTYTYPGTQPHTYSGNMFHLNKALQVLLFRFENQIRSRKFFISISYGQALMKQIFDLE